MYSCKLSLATLLFNSFITLIKKKKLCSFVHALQMYTMMLLDQKSNQTKYLSTKQFCSTRTRLLLRNLPSQNSISQVYVSVIFGKEHPAECKTDCKKSICLGKKIHSTPIYYRGDHRPKTLGVHLFSSKTIQK